MKKIIDKFLIVSSVVLFASCSGVHRLTIEVQEPASVTFPIDATKVVVVNNAVVQPDSVGLESSYNGKKTEGMYPSLDSIPWVSVESISERLEDSDFFSQVAIYRSSLRSDNQWLAKGRLSKDFREQFLRETGMDAIISVDQLLFNTVQDGIPLSDDMYLSNSYLFTDIRVTGVISISIYVKDKESPLSSFSLKDSTFTKTSAYSDLKESEVIRRLLQSMIFKVAYKLGDKTAILLTPTWKTADRIVYAGYSSRMKEATSYFKSNKWSKAEDIWLSEYDKKEKPLDKARMSVNMAVANEMQDDLDTALTWVKKAKEYYLQTDAKDNANEIEHVDKYTEVLEKRIQNSRVLDLQWGVEENINELQK